VKISLYIEHGVGNGVGGAELMMAHLAAVWSAAHEVDFIHHRPPLTRERIASFSDEDYSRVNFVYVPREAEGAAAGNPLARYRGAKDWHRRVSEGYDVFVNCTHWLPCFNHAATGVLLTLFPFYVRPQDSPELQALPLWKRLRHRAYYDVEWQARMNTYGRRVAISRFSAEWTSRRWHINPEVVYPPVDVHSDPGGNKDLAVLSVGRFSTMAHTKKQLEMVDAFCALEEALPQWSYACVGGLNTREENHRYFARVQEAAAGRRVHVAANLAKAEIGDLFERSRIFWHATGLDIDESSHPELCEHFGISTVEAMAAGCVPVVINKGGQPEIVEHGVTGFVWNTLAEMREYTILLARDTALWQRMSDAARARAARFSRERFVAQMTDMCGVRPAEPTPIGTVARAEHAPQAAAGRSSVL
jgi:glycosyltransferase involved in cell wall biosynthesis